MNPHELEHEPPVLIVFDHFLLSQTPIPGLIRLIVVDLLLLWPEHHELLKELLEIDLVVLGRIA